jgi:hypothetical protein
LVARPGIEDAQPRRDFAQLLELGDTRLELGDAREDAVF